MINNNAMEAIDSLFVDILETRLHPEGYGWLCEQGAALRETARPGQLSRIFAQVPRFAIKADPELAAQQLAQSGKQLPVNAMREWSTDTLSRIWLLLQVPDGDQISYVATIDPLFVGAEVNELVALYKSLELLAYPEQWITRCEEGIRSNIGSVLEAIMYNNNYPAVYLKEAAWNQMILKAFFTDKDVRQIRGLEQRMNPRLKAALEDYVQERTAAGRSVNPEIYKLMELQ
jgi:hypothetical protein